MGWGWGLWWREKLGAMLDGVLDCVTPLHYAAWKAEAEAAKALLEAGADKEAKDKVCVGGLVCETGGAASVVVGVGGDVWFT
eukprot:1457066-Rhodomonas_salina.1